MTRAKPAPLPLFDGVAALQARDDALDRVEANHADWLGQARAEARRIARLHGTVTADAVRAVMEAKGLRPRHYNAWGAVFRRSEFEWTGKWHRSSVRKGNGNMQRVWRLREG